MTVEVILAAGQRSAFGDFGGALKDLALTDVATRVVQATIGKAGVTPADFDHLVFGNTMYSDKDAMFGARVVAMKSGLPEEAGALGVVRACGTGVQSIISASQQILSGHSALAIAAGGENYSRVPYAVTTARWGHKRGPQELEDQLDWVYRCPFSGELMGETGENLAADFGYERVAMDDWGYMSQQRAGQGITSGFLARQIVPIQVPDGRKGTRAFAVDEFPRPQITREKLAQLRPVFKPDGQITAGNASGVTDGACALVVADRVQAEARGVRPEARLVDWVAVGVPPRIMGIGPVPAIRRLLARQDMVISDIDYFEINEAFAVVNLHAEAELGVPRDATNLYGGGISIGHPPGATGLRMTMTAMHHLADTGGRFAMISMCLGGGQGMAMLIENLLR